MGSGKAPHFGRGRGFKVEREVKKRAHFVKGGGQQALIHAMVDHLEEPMFHAGCPYDVGSFDGGLLIALEEAVKVDVWLTELLIICVH